MSKTPTSALHLQMGQEVLYLLLVTSLICNLLLVGLVMRAHAREPSAREPSPDEMAATITRLEGEKAGLLLQVRQLNDTLEDAKRERANLDASVEQAQSARVQLEGWVKELEGKLKIQKTPLEDQPPIIMLRDTEGYSFDPGSADIKPEFLFFHPRCHVGNPILSLAGQGPCRIIRPAGSLPCLAMPENIEIHTGENPLQG